jgi:hypothetical protein
LPPRFDGAAENGRSSLLSLVTETLMVFLYDARDIYTYGGFFTTQLSTFTGRIYPVTIMKVES